MLAAGVGLALPLSGCLGGRDEGQAALATETPPPPVDELEIRIYDVRRPDAGARSATLTVLLEVTNPTEREVPSPSGEFDVMINGERVVTAEPSFNTFEPGETARKSMELIIDYADSGTAVANAIREGTFRLTMDGLIRAGDVSDSVTLSYEL